jgi:hypothetical protein
MMFAQYPNQTWGVGTHGLGLATTTLSIADLVASNENAPDPDVWGYTKTNNSWFSASSSVLNLITNSANSYSILKGDDTYGAYGLAVRVKAKAATANDYQYGSVGLGTDADTTETNEVEWEFLNAADAATELYRLAKATHLTHVHKDVAPTAWHIYEGQWIASDNVEFFYDDASGGAAITDANDIPSVALSPRLAAWTGASGQPSIVNVDYILLRKCVADEPHFGSAGAEAATPNAYVLFGASNF